MKKILLLLALSISCGGAEEEKYTWGQLAEEISVVYCGALADPCRYLSSDDDIAYCIDHNAWHLCEPDRSCDVELDEEEAHRALDACDARLQEMDAAECTLIVFYGLVPDECLAVLEMSPGPQP